MRNCAKVCANDQQHGNSALQHQFRLVMQKGEISLASKSLQECNGWIATLEVLVTPAEPVYYKNNANPNPQLVTELESALERVMERMVSEIKARMSNQSTDILVNERDPYQKEMEERIIDALKSCIPAQKEMEERIIGSFKSQSPNSNVALESRMAELSRTMESRTNELTKMVGQILQQPNESSPSHITLQDSIESLGARSNELTQIKNSLQDFLAGQKGSKAMLESNLYGDTVNQIQDLLKNMGRSLGRQSDQHAEEIHPKLDNLVEVGGLL
jgi:hypothetical protein